MRANWDEPPGRPGGPGAAPPPGANRLPGELRLCEPAPIPEVNVYLGNEVDKATVRIEVVQEYPGRLGRLWAICLTVIFVAAAAARVAEILAG